MVDGLYANDSLLADHAVGTGAVTLQRDARDGNGSGARLRYGSERSRFLDVAGGAVLLLGFALPRRLLQPVSLLVLFGVLFVRGILCFVHTRQHPETPVFAPVKHYIPDEDKEV